ncbi:TPA: serine acetyltransferase [bacterium]|nr:serine acetyltransferase [bacterium]
MKPTDENKCAPQLKCSLREKLPGVVESIYESYQNTPKTRNIGESPLPNKASIINILESIREILFPGYYGTSGLCWENIRYFIGSKLDELFVNLSTEISRSLRHECKETGHICIECIDRSGQYCMDFFSQLPKIRDMLVYDVQFAYDGDPAAKGLDEIIFSYPGIMAITTYRIAHELLILGVPSIPRIMTEYAHGITGIDIHPGARIGKSFFIDHGTGVVIGETCEIGERVKLYQGVTLGALSFPKDDTGSLIRGRKRHPTIEDDVTIYAGATILGGDTVIGKGSVIGGNVWLVSSVPPGTKVTIEAPQLKFKMNSITA